MIRRWLIDDRPLDLGSGFSPRKYPAISLPLAAFPLLITCTLLNIFGVLAMLGPGYRYKSTITSAAVLAVILVIQVYASPADQNGKNSNNQPDLATLIQNITRAQIANRIHVKPYSVVREYKVFEAGAERPRTQVLARVSFLPPDQKSYEIDRSTGGIGGNVIRHILDHEVDAARDPREVIVSGDNYKFEYLGEDVLDGQPCYKLRISSKHDRKELLNGTIWVGQTNYRILRMEGEPAKSPSFWVKDVHIVLEFRDVAGMWMQNATHATAHIRFGGEYHVTSQDLNYDLGSVVAANSRPSHHRNGRALIAAEVQGLH
jgi:hypothetical protein